MKDYNCTTCIGLTSGDCGGHGPLHPDSSPYTCPVCSGNGLVSYGFYNQTGGSWYSSSTAGEMCKSCDGKGIVWHG